jgi:hypothetical protein
MACSLFRDYNKQIATSVLRIRGGAQRRNKILAKSICQFAMVCELRHVLQPVSNNINVCDESLWSRMKAVK